jgi:LPS-assembly lipoprotein
MRFYVTILISGLCLLTAACGFEPVYGVNRNMPVGIEETFEQISMENIPNREGQYLRNALIDRFYRHGRPASTRYSLVVSPLSESLLELDVTRTADATRGQLRIETDMALRDQYSGQIVLRRHLQAIGSYNILASEFSTRVTEDNARMNALDDLARQVELQLSLYFRRQ